MVVVVIVCIRGHLQSNNMVFDTVARHYHQLHASDKGQGSLPHVVITNLEHDSVDLTARKMAEMGRIGKWLSCFISRISIRC